MVPVPDMQPAAGAATDDPPVTLLCGDRSLSLDRPRVMGILNVTPDSFSDGGRHSDVEGALAHARRLIAEGADIVDVGGESTRPGADPVTLEQELERVVPVIERVVAEGEAIVSIDTSRPEVMRAAVAAGAGLINDVRALRTDGALAAAAAADVPICLMHMRGEPGDMQDAPRYADVVEEVRDFLAGRIARCTAAGIAPERLLVDPGFGFGKTLPHNVALLRGLARVATLAPLLVGVSRKGMIGALGESFGPRQANGDIAAERLQGSIVAALYAVRQGACIVRVHDVRATVMALAVQHGIDHSRPHENGAATHGH